MLSNAKRAGRGVHFSPRRRGAENAGLETDWPNSKWTGKTTGQCEKQSYTDDILPGPVVFQAPLFDVFLQSCIFYRPS